MIHIMPNREIKLHQECTTCECGPSVIMEDEIIVVHQELTHFRESDYITDEDPKLLRYKDPNA